jgi:hypothetical protein
MIHIYEEDPRDMKENRSDLLDKIAQSAYITCEHARRRPQGDRKVAGPVGNETPRDRHGT